MNCASLRSSIVCLLATVAFAATPDAGAQTTQHYKFLYGSTMTETGGIAGWRSNWHVLGPFDFEITPDPRDWWPPQDTAKFTNMEAWATHEIMTVIHPRTPNEIFNFTGLTGVEVRAPGPLDVFNFRGTTEDGSRVRITAGLLGRWMFVRAKTEAPVGSADYFEYTLRALARQQSPVDVDDNGTVDGADLSALVAKFGTSSAIPSNATGGSGGDGVIDGAVLLAWQREAGDVPPGIIEFEQMIDAAIAASGESSFAAVPEPTAALLALMAISGLATVRRR